MVAAAAVGASAEVGLIRSAGGLRLAGVAWADDGAKAAKKLPETDAKT